MFIQLNLMASYLGKTKTALITAGTFSSPCDEVDEMATLQKKGIGRAHVFSVLTQYDGQILR